MRQLAAALETLQAAVDVESDGLEWHPAEDRPITIGLETEPDQLRWVVFDDFGRTVAHSANYDPATFPSQWRPAAWPADPPDATAIGSSGTWRLAARRLRAVDLASRKDAKPVKPPDNDLDDDESNELDTAGRRFVGPGRRPTSASWRRPCAWWRTAFWVVCALLGRRFAQRALEPAASKWPRRPERCRPPIATANCPALKRATSWKSSARRSTICLGRMQLAIDQRERFAGDASHQLRTPLAGMLSAVEVARRRERSAADYAQSLDQVHAEALRMRQIVESLLFLARGTSDCGRIGVRADRARHLVGPRAGSLGQRPTGGRPAYR